MENILIIGAHFDDADLGAGGSAAKWVSQGKKVYKYTLTDNETHFAQRNIHVSFDDSKKQSAMAAKALGITEIENPCPIHQAELIFNKDVMQEVEKIIFDYNIDTVILHFNSDMHQDHVEASKICLTAARHCRNILEYRSNGYILDSDFHPTYFVDISDFIDQKKKALACYGQEHNRTRSGYVGFDKDAVDPKNSLFTMNIERNHIWGYANEVEYAEGFRVVKMMG